MILVNNSTKHKALSAYPYQILNQAINRHIWYHGKFDLNILCSNSPENN